MSGRNPAVGASFADRLLAWFDVHGRRGLPWQSPRSAYRVWLSEVMLQQTQVATVIPYFERFIARFPDFASLAAADIDEVLALWAGLGYYARGRNLHGAAKQVATVYRGEMPNDLEAVQALPGVGRSTAAAILAQAYGARHAILDGNVKRVLARHAAIAGWPGTPKVADRLWAISEQKLPMTRLADYTQAIMDLGATLCTARAPACARCPVAADCLAHREGRIGEFPSPKPAKSRPYRRATLLVVENEQGAILIERRPPTGIWGGLWSLPVAAEGESADVLLRQRHGIRIEPIDTLPAFRHAFTHFELELTPLLCTLIDDDAPTEVRERPDQRWLTISARSGDALAGIGLPAPVLGFLSRRYALNATNDTSTSDPCPAPSTASSSGSKPKASRVRRSPAR
nr:A/G-specific adenine glycosylase [Nevskia sp.]